MFGARWVRWGIWTIVHGRAIAPIFMKMYYVNTLRSDGGKTMPNPDVPKTKRNAPECDGSLL